MTATAWEGTFFIIIVKGRHLQRIILHAYIYVVVRAYYDTHNIIMYGKTEEKKNKIYTRRFALVFCAMSGYNTFPKRFLTPLCTPSPLLSSPRLTIITIFSPAAAHENAYPTRYHVAATLAAWPTRPPTAHSSCRPHPFSTHSCTQYYNIIMMYTCTIIL